MNTGSPVVGEAERMERFYRTRAFFHEGCVRFLPDEASDIVLPARYSQGRIMLLDWRQGALYQGDIP